MLEREIEILSGKKKELGIFTQTCCEFVDGFACFFKKGNYSNFLPIYFHS